MSGRILFLQFMEKSYFSIGEVSTELNVPQTTLRFWEKQFADMPGFLSHKNDRGTRRYSRQNLDNCRTLQYLLKQKGMTIEGAKRTLRAGGKSTQAASEEDVSRTVVEKLIAIRDEIQGMADVYDDIIKGHERQ